MTQRERDLVIAEHKWEKEKPLQEREYKLKQEQAEFKKAHSSKKISTSKLLIALLFINCTLIELFTGYITLKSFDLASMTYTMPDFTPLTTLIGAVVGEVIGFAIYSIKSAKENTAGGIVYETAMMNMKTSDDIVDTTVDPNGVG